MKKVFIVLFAAVCCLTSCMTSETDCIYQISVGMDQYSVSTMSPSESADLIKEFETKNTELVKKLDSEIGTEWKITVKNGKYGAGDSEAKAKFDRYVSERKTFNETWMAKFKACSDTRSSLVYKYHVTLSRISEDGNKELAKESLGVEFNK